MIIPEPEDLDFSDRYLRDFKGRTSLLFEKPSPILPLHYDKKYLPSTWLYKSGNLCEKEYLDLFECIVFHSNDSGKSCSYDVMRFENCRKDRDIKILHSIKDW